jgi:flotillin
MEGEIGEALNLGKTKQEVAKINANTAVQETERKIEKAKAESKFKSQEIDIERRLNIERIQAERAAELKNAELQKGVEESKALMELERQRATNVTKARVAKESAAEEADAQFYKARQVADAQLYKVRQDTDANAYQSSKVADLELYTTEKQAEGYYLRKQRETEAKQLQDTKIADVSLYRKQQDAQGDFEIKRLEAEALYIKHEKEAAGITQLAGAYEKLSQVLGGPAGVRDWMMLQSNLPVQLARANAEAIKGLQPKINVWTTGSQDGATDSFAPIRNIMQSLPPLFSTIQDQTGMVPPAWMAQMPGASSSSSSVQKRSDSPLEIPSFNGKFKAVNGA